jgi:threonine dehydrogenase-like Zn-dependent dehydrogenase
MTDLPMGATLSAPETSCVHVPSALGSKEAWLAIPLASALYVWDRLQLELGEVAIYTAGSDFGDLIGQVAIWRGALPVIRLDNHSVGMPSLDKGERLSMADPEEALQKLRLRIKDKPGFAAVDFSGRPEVIDLILEAMPRWGRVMLAGRTKLPVTVDFYNNVHRKGALLLCETFEHVAFFEQKESDSCLSLAFRLLEKKDIAEACARLVGGATAS